jgi:hypothetical protein
MFITLNTGLYPEPFESGPYPQNTFCLYHNMMEIEITVLIQVVTDIPAQWAPGWTAVVPFQVGARDFSLLHYSNQLWGPPSFLASEY